MKIAPHHIVMFLLGLVLLLVVAVVLLRLPTTTIPSVGATVEAGEIIETSDLVEISWPVNAVFPDLITEPGELVGRRAVTRITANQPVSRPMLTTPNATGDDAPVDPRYLDFDANKLQYYLPVDLRRLSGGLVQNGDWVNIMQVGDGGARFLLQKIHIIDARTAGGASINESSGDAAAGGAPAAPVVPAGVMLALTPDQMQTIIAIPAEQLHLIKTTPDAPDLPGVPTGLQMYNPAGSAGPSLAPTPSPSPSSSPAPSEPGEPGEQPGSSEEAAPSEQPIESSEPAPTEPGESAPDVSGALLRSLA